jgi:hypothetical protein
MSALIWTAAWCQPMVEWIATHPNVVIVSCEAAVVTVFIAFCAVQIHAMRQSSKEAARRLRASDAEFQKVMRGFRRTQDMMADCIESDTDVVERIVN